MTDQPKTVADQIKAGDRLKCVDAYGCLGLTECTIYTALSIEGGGHQVLVKDDLGENIVHFTSRFERLPPVEQGESPAASIRQHQIENMLTLGVGAWMSPMELLEYLSAPGNTIDLKMLREWVKEYFPRFKAFQNYIATLTHDLAEANKRLDEDFTCARELLEFQKFVFEELGIPLVIYSDTEARARVKAKISHLAHARDEANQRAERAARQRDTLAKINGENQIYGVTEKQNFVNFAEECKATIKRLEAQAAEYRKALDNCIEIAKEGIDSYKASEAKATDDMEKLKWRHVSAGLMVMHKKLRAFVKAANESIEKSLSTAAPAKPQEGAKERWWRNIHPSRGANKILTDQQRRNCIAMGMFDESDFIETDASGQPLPAPSTVSQEQIQKALDCIPTTVEEVAKAEAEMANNPPIELPESLRDPNKVLERILSQERDEKLEAPIAINSLQEHDLNAKEPSIPSGHLYDSRRIFEWEPTRKPAHLAFTDGPERRIAEMVEMRRDGERQARQAHFDLLAGIKDALGVERIKAERGEGVREATCKLVRATMEALRTTLAQQAAEQKREIEELRGTMGVIETANRCGAAIQEIWLKRIWKAIGGIEESATVDEAIAEIKHLHVRIQKNKQEALAAHEVTIELQTQLTAAQQENARLSGMLQEKTE